MSKYRDILDEFFDGDDPGFIVGTFDGVLSGTHDTNVEVLAGMEEQYQIGFDYGKYHLAMENPRLFSRILTSGETISQPEIVSNVDLLKGYREDEDDE